jgi:CBS domain containing-hemolysin-like protein
MIWSLGLIVLLIGLQGFFSGSEIALVSADRVRLDTDRRRGSRSAAIAMDMLEQPARMLGTCLVGTNLCAIAIATLATSLVINQLHGPPALAALLVLPFTLTLGELVPKAIYQHHADRLVPILVHPLRVLALLLTPALWVFEQVARLAGAGSTSPRTVTREEIQILLDGLQDAELTAKDRKMIRRVFAFTEAVVEDAMVPLIRVSAIPSTATCAEAVEAMILSGHSRLPVYRERVDDICGVVLHHDLLSQADWQMSIASITRPALFVPETKRVDQLLLDMRRARQRMAVAVDEYGGAVGIITVEDLLEEIVGEIEDESDREGPRVRRLGDRDWLASGRAEREHLEDECGLKLPDGDFETIAGYILSTLGRIPRLGETVTVDAHTLTVSKVTDRAILEIYVRASHR